MSEEQKSDSTQAEHVHCWHPTGIAYMTNPPQYPEVCCHCGEKRVRRKTVPSTEGHGPYLPKGGQW